MIFRLYSHIRGLVAATPALSDFAPNLPSEPPARALAPRDLPATRYLAGLTQAACPATQAVTDALIDDAPKLRWEQSYTADQVGQDYLDRYGWVHVLSPEGPLVDHDIRITIGFWDAGLAYPRHRHAPEEIYCVLAGGARFDSEGRAPFAVRPGDTVHHAPNQWHAIDMTPGPLLALAIWKGEALLDVSELGATG